MKAQAKVFEFSPTVIDHLGRQLYRNFITVIGEAVSNAWDADAENVWITIDPGQKTMSVIDDGVGMSDDDIAQKFLKIGYSKRGRKRDKTHSDGRNRPYIGAKGIGKIALLTCASTLAIASKTSHDEPAGCLISNRQLDEAIERDEAVSEVELQDAPTHVYDLLDRQVSSATGHGTVLYLQEINLRGSRPETLAKLMARAFRFSLIDEHFTIYLNGDKVDESSLSDLAEKTQYVWKIGDIKDPYLDSLKDQLTVTEQMQTKRSFTFKPDTFGAGLDVCGFIASTEHPRDLAIFGKGERIGVDLFVNGRLRERDILRHIPSARLAEQYIYGCVHIDKLDRPGADPFTSSREGIIEDDPIYTAFLEYLDKAMKSVLSHWDALRNANRQSGDHENPDIPRVERAAQDMTSAIIQELTSPAKSESAKNWNRKINEHSDEQAKLAATNFAYFFVIENLIRSVLQEHGVHYQDVHGKIDRNRSAERRRQKALGIKQARAEDNDLWYLGLKELMELTNNDTGAKFFSFTDEEVDLLSLVRNITMHTSKLTHEAQTRFSKVMSLLVEKARRKHGF